ncbi:hypothetical protein SanaruYs_10930 [Chryseotalea sanaruensis]|uniref:Uncharacterized protein n=1 Tax=Chryseotalea sanaruensis TaxID=2482724 RepID=A0A401U7K8_9BACT|nr:hypothetical protein [Chryseotalea sanaruensis]GCC50874.1 hypothetical protein SanaruYs_10930 [Chryseotalea sanaruensis]
MRKSLIKILSLCVITFVLALGVDAVYAVEASDPCNGPCVRKVVDCQPSGSKCSESGNQCGVEQECKGGGGASVMELQ